MTKKRLLEEPDIKSEEIKDNQTWNTCPDCHLSWETKPSIPGLIHRTRLCHNCATKKK